jgi:pimeloyl-ACP methyl ester carboxylesterase
VVTAQRHFPESAELSVPRLARDVAELADHLGAQRFHVAGSSAGSNVAAKTAIDYPERVLSLGAFACSGGIRHGLQDQNSWVKKIGEKGSLPSCARRLQDRVNLKSAEPGFVDWFIDESGKTSVATLERFVPMMRQFEFVSDLRASVVPRWPSSRAETRYTPSTVSRLPDRIADCEFVVYEKLPHNITDAVPDRCARDYRGFLLKHVSMTWFA